MKKLIFTFIIATICGISAFAYDFSARCSSGQTLYYKITSSTSPYKVQVTYPGDGTTYFWNTTQKPTGNLIIPSSVTYNNRTYSVTNIGQAAFYICSELTSVSISNSVTVINDNAFGYCSGLTSVTIPNSVTSIGDGAFYGCSGLTEVTIGTGVTEIGYKAFNNCSGQTTVNFNATNCTSMPGIVAGDDKTVFDTSLATLNIGENVRNIPEYAFYGCSGLTEVTIPNSVISIGDRAFYGCSGLTEVTIGNSVTDIGARAFYNCNGLTAVYYTGSIAQWCGISFGNTYSSNPLFYAHNLYVNNSLVTDLVIPNTVAEIKMHAFHGGRCLTSVSIPNSVTSIGSSAFGHCYGLTSVTIPESIGSIGNSAFYRCYGLDTVNFNATNCTIMGSSDNPVFNYDTLAVLNIGENVTNIPANAFKNCSGFTEVTIPNSVTNIGSQAFSGCNELTTFNFNAENCSGTISGSLFDSNNTLSKIIIGENVTTIPNNAFKNCSSLDSIISAAANPPVIYGGTFDSELSLNTPIVVPCGMVEAYEDADFWYNFRRIQQAPGCIQSYTITVMSANPNRGTVTGGGTYPEGTVITIEATALEGFEFVSWSDDNTENPRQITVTTDATYIASFDEISTVTEYTITVMSANTNHGTVTGGGTYPEGSVITIEANASEHYHFAQWNDGNTDNPRTITVTGDATYTASFAIDRFTITVESADEAMGTVSESNTYDYGTEIQISATASNGYHFAQWSDGNTDNPRTITVTGDATYIATFAPNNYTIVVRSLNEDWGTVSEGGTFPYGTEIQISATPRENYAFVAWTDGNTDNPRTITVTEDATYRASFAAESFTITVVSDDEAMGTVSEGGTFPYGTEIQIYATPRDTYIYGFVGWNDGNTDNPRTITVVADAEYIAYFISLTGIDESAVSEIALFPNPATDILNITSSETISEIEIVNTLGQVVKRIEVNSDNAVCDVEDLKAGVYVVRIHGTVVSQRKFIKE